MNNQLEGNGNQMEEEEEFQIIAEDHSTSPEDIYFDTVVGALQDIIVEEEFEKMQRPFMDKHCSLFEDNEENRFEYTEVFTQYQKEIQQYVEKSLALRVPDFEMSKFQGLLESRTDQIDQFILDILESFSQFSAFKKLMLEHRVYLQNEDKMKGLSIKSSRLS